MNKDKLESLRRLASDERTPVEEARNAALAFVRGGGQAETDADHLAVMTKERDAARQDIAALRLEKQQRDALLERLGREKTKAENEAARLRSILTRLMDARKAEELAGKVRAQAEQEARDALDGKEKKTRHENEDPVADASCSTNGATRKTNERVSVEDYYRNAVRGGGWKPSW